MAPSVGLLESGEDRALPLMKPLNEAAWQAWISKNRAQDRRNNATFLSGVKWITIAGLLVAAAFWSYLGPFDLAVRFMVAAGAVIAMFQAFHIRQFVLAGLFGALLVLFNPVAPVLSFSGEWQRAILAASTLPFFVSLWLEHFEDKTRS